MPTSGRRRPGACCGLCGRRPVGSAGGSGDRGGAGEGAQSGGGCEAGGSSPISASTRAARIGPRPGAERSTGASGCWSNSTARACSSSLDCGLHGGMTVTSPVTVRPRAVSTGSGWRSAGVFRSVRICSTRAVSLRRPHRCSSATTFRWSTHAERGCRRGGQDGQRGFVLELRKRRAPRGDRTPAIPNGAGWWSDASPRSPPDAGGPAP